MAKILFRRMIWGIVVFALAVLVGYLAYTWTFRYQTDKLRRAWEAEEVAMAASAGQDVEGKAAESYLARLENHAIAIYTVTEGEERFLYCLEVYTGGFPAEELLRLRRGVLLEDRRALAAFEEDYSS